MQAGLEHALASLTAGEAGTLAALLAEALRHRRILMFIADLCVLLPVCCTTGPA